MSNFLTESFLLDTDIAEFLYHDVAKDMPIIDYHCHLPAHEIAENIRFRNLTEIWLGGDHYKWRALRTNGIDEARITGDASDRDKFQAFAETVPFTLGNPIYHWTHLEMRRPFGITDVELNGDTAESVWQRANELLAQDNFRARGIMEQMNVRMVGTTDDPVDDLSAHRKIAKDGFTIKVLPSWRPDRCFLMQAEDYPAYIEKLANVSDTDIGSFQSLCQALDQRLEHFASHGCCIADHGLDNMVYGEASEAELDRILQARLAGQKPNADAQAAFQAAVLVYLGKRYHQLGWAQQYHIGALRNNNGAMFASLGANTGFDSINDRPYAEALSRLLDAQAISGQLPKTILYCLNPSDNEMLATMCGNFQGDKMVGKVQFGSGWWFNDQKDGMERQLQQLAQLGLLSRFVGMLTDSRSFLSYTRHEYFRRILCRMLGHWVRDGEAPNDKVLLSRMVSDICFHNANRYFNLNISI
ncbi:glucuronate isomerase [Gynuella sunshinyii]|uniref:Uronate isomerase n=1 Tax=Gynuella sunshinyii YC6258 TaxID=1445510 RepID=A0A0C5W312_9GAMM|nr:glucuronate isomerase [Gynuella sunshinyii]AJQ97054.1 glucuronate isomerase [Gynuella sunshinyii YC6258]